MLIFMGENGWVPWAFADKYIWESDNVRSPEIKELGESFCSPLCAWDVTCTKMTELQQLKKIWLRVDTALSSAQPLFLLLKRNSC